MVFAPHTRVTFTGLLGTTTAPVERWAVRLNMTNGAGAGDPAALAAAGVTSWGTRIKGLLQSQCILTEVKVAAIDAGGLYIGDPTIATASVSGTAASSPRSPYQMAIAVSLDTDRRGPTGKGRVFLPAPLLVVDGPTGLIPAVDATAFATAVANLCSDLNAVSSYGAVCIASSKGYNTAVKSTRCGRVPDTIRSRRNRLVEQYVSDVTVAQ